MSITNKYLGLIMSMISRNTVAVLLAAFALLFSVASLADCARPRPSFEISDGSSATEKDMTTLQGQLVAFADQVREYLRCLNGEMSQKSVGKDEATRTALDKAHLTAHNDAANELGGLADCYAAQVETFKKSGGGTQKRAADCSTYIKEAASRKRGGPIMNNLVVEASGTSIDIPGGSWLYYLVRDDTPRRCTDAAGCLYRGLHVRNDSDSTLECSGQITYEGADVAGNATTRARALVPERSTYVVLDSLSKQGVNAKTFDMDCKPRAKLPPLATAANCKYEVIKPIAIGDYYPATARQGGEEGPVVVEFTVDGKNTRPTDVKAVASSLFESLDQAAVKAVSDMVMSSNCPKARYRLKLSFQLEQ